MIEITNKADCCGCEACVQVCPKRCISFVEDAEGFRYPSVNTDLCVNCSLCEKVCPVINQNNKKEPLEVFAAKNKNEQDLLLSSSGGIFLILANRILKEGGVVFGARFDEQWNVVHSYSETEEGVRAFMGSKYVQSRIGSSYMEVRDFLLKGRKVLYSGTSCQIAGLKRFLQRDFDNLLTIDMICHGVPSPKVWRRYLTEISQDNKGSIKSISFRDKQINWKNFSFTLHFAETSTDRNQSAFSLTHMHKEDPYMRLFLRNLILRPSCYKCPAKQGKSWSDLTIADFWGIEKFYPNFDDERGVGLLMVNSEKGRNAIDLAEDAMLMKEVSLSEATECNPSYYYSVGIPDKRDKCFQMINSSRKDINTIVYKLFHISIGTRIKRKMINTLHAFIK